MSPCHYAISPYVIVVAYMTEREQMDFFDLGTVMMRICSHRPVIHATKGFSRPHRVQRGEPL